MPTYIKETMHGTKELLSCEEIARNVLDLRDLMYKKATSKGTPNLFTVMSSTEGEIYMHLNSCLYRRACKELTVAELESILGYSIKIVGK